MGTRLPLNRNETRFILPCYRGLHVINHRGPLVEKYLEDAFRTIACALADYPKIFAFRFDLRFPLGSEGWGSHVISRFTDSFKAQIKAYLNQQGWSESVCLPRFIWAKERNLSKNIHYHLVILLNKDVFFRSGRINSEHKNLARRVEQAWATALGLNVLNVKGLVDFPDNRDYIVNRHSKDFLQQLTNLFYRVSYLAKEETKEYCDGSRHFSCSHFTPLPLEFSLEELVQFHKHAIHHMPQYEYLLSDESWEYRYRQERNDDAQGGVLGRRILAQLP